MESKEEKMGGYLENEPDITDTPSEPEDHPLDDYRDNADSAGVDGDTKFEENSSDVTE